MVTFFPHLRLSAIGHLGTPAVDHFSFGLSMSDATFGGFPTPLDEGVAAYLQNLADHIKDYFIDSNALINESAFLDAVKIASIGTSGSYLFKPPHITEYNNPGAGTIIGNETPQTALCVSLTTDIVGPRTRGRFYLPMPTVPTSVEDGYRISMASAQNVRDRVVTLIQDLNSETPPAGRTLRVCIASSTGINTEVTGVRVGRVIDTVRTRRNDIDEDYTTVASV